MNRFFQAAEEYDAWWRAGQNDPKIFTLGEATAGAAAATAAVRAKIDDFFARCRLAAFDNRATSALNREEKDYAALGAQDLAASVPELASWPVAQVAANRSLPLGDGVNPAWGRRHGRVSREGGEAGLGRPRGVVGPGMGTDPGTPGGVRRLARRQSGRPWWNRWARLACERSWPARAAKP